MEKQYQKAFCIICKNKSLSKRSGVICGLTDLQPSFEDNCNLFKLDKQEIDKKINVFRQQTSERYFSSKVISSIARTPQFVENKFIEKIAQQKVKKAYGVKFTNRKYNIRNHILFSIFLLILLVFGNLKNNMGWDLKSPNVLGIIILFIISISYLIYKLNNHKVYTITVEKEYIDFNGKKITWNNILDFGILSGKHESKLILGTLLNGIIKIDLSKLNVSEKEIVNIIRVNKKRFPILYKTN